VRVFGGNKLFGRRKLLVSVLTLLLTALLTATGNVTSGDYRFIVIAVVGLYGWSNYKSKENGNEKGAS
jgi:4-amino-4-deoxy-L-arabinose transferase-like glycosyltransferase